MANPDLEGCLGRAADSHPFVLSFLSGFLLVLPFPNFGFFPLGWIALVPLLACLVTVRGLGRAGACGGITGLFFFGGLLYWIPGVLVRYGQLHWITASLVYLLMITALASFLAAFGLVQKAALRRYGGGVALALAPAAWTALELARNYLAVNGFPWGALGYSQVPIVALVQITDVTGIYGVSFLLVAFNGALAHLLLDRGGIRPRVVPVVAVGVLVVATSAYGWVRLRQPAGPASGDPIRVAAVQGNISLNASDSEISEVFFRDYPRMIDRAAVQGSSLVILPESPNPHFFQSDLLYRRHLVELARRYRVGVLFNNTAYEGPSRNLRYFNSALLVDEEGSLASRYDKVHLVPFGEYVPWRGILTFVTPLVREVSEFSPGRDFTLGTFRGRPFGTFICYEAIFPELVRTFSFRGAEFLINITNDAWFGATAAPEQHFQMVQVRAIENRRYVARAANSGVSGIIAPSGRILARTAIFRQALLVGDLVPYRVKTLYVRHGDVFAWACVGITALAVAGGAASKR